MLADMPVERLKDATRDQLGSAAHRRGHPHDPGGPRSARTTWSTCRASARPPRNRMLGRRTDSGRRRTTRCRSASTSRTGRPQRPSCSGRCSAWDACGGPSGATADLALAEALRPLADVAGQRRHASIVVLCRQPVRRRPPRSSADRHATRRARLLRWPELRGQRDPWDDFLAAASRLLRDALRARLPDRRRGEDPRRPARRDRRGRPRSRTRHRVTSPPRYAATSASARGSPSSSAR